MLSNLSFGPTNKTSQLQSPGLTSPNSYMPAMFTDLDDELRDARRVHSQGQEEDLRYALDRVIKRVEDLSSLLKTAYKTQTELETQLNLTKSNLQLVISNNEMLEEALKRETPCSARDVGWRRWSAREVQNQNADKAAEDRAKSLDYGPLNESGTPAVPSNAAVVLVNGSNPPASTVASPAPPPPTPMTGQESRFFKFRFTSGGVIVNPCTKDVPDLHTGSKSPAIVHPSHLTSPSLPSLISQPREKEFEDLQEQLERERQAHKAVTVAKATLEAELESLSQALFEEANKMVATERMKRAETEEELKEVRTEKDALREALRLIEGENGQLRSANASSGTRSNRTEALPSSTPSHLFPALLSLSPPSPSLPSTGSPGAINDETTTPVVTPFVAEMPKHLASFALEPAPKPSLHQRTMSAEKLTAASTSTVSLNDPLPVVSEFASSFSVPLTLDEPSPWADATSHSS
ncbi:hypothetical protein PAXRUDRAFT_822806 [Paxillus rubicundulus Ve08.2h10]|uniref:GDP/GTP exchange factor Sec2 N-terminal domain-containing protein n=1 Tax=Paxillus rubicundulus Ve08.2h10 TaxID=930991 RepID=A0A0D0DW42_9AGAM|nr:hypothetical protein PAXRUDRAFT_822806 [Paxillus rubicundulus Ve08.2h10]